MTVIPLHIEALLEAFSRFSGISSECESWCGAAEQRRWLVYQPRKNSCSTLIYMEKNDNDGKDHYRL
jgi:hypothetical protein